MSLVRSSSLIGQALHHFGRTMRRLIQPLSASAAFAGAAEAICGMLAENGDGASPIILFLTPDTSDPYHRDPRALSDTIDVGRNNDERFACGATTLREA